MPALTIQQMDTNTTPGSLRHANDPQPNHSVQSSPSPLSCCHTCGHTSKRRAYHEAQINDNLACLADDERVQIIVEAAQHKHKKPYHYQRYLENIAVQAALYRIPVLSGAETRVDGSWLVETSRRLNWRVSDLAFVGYSRGLTKLKPHPLDQSPDSWPQPIVQVPMPPNSRKTSSNHTSKGYTSLHNGSQYNETAVDTTDDSDEDTCNTPCLSDGPDLAEYKYIYRFVCKKCGDHRHQTENCTEGKGEKVSEKQNDVPTEEMASGNLIAVDGYQAGDDDASATVEQWYQQQARVVTARWWRNVMVLEGERRPYVPYCCGFCDGDYENPAGQCAFTDNAASCHRRLQKLFTSWKYRNRVLREKVQSQRSLFFKYLRVNHPRRLEWYRGSPTMPAAMNHSFDQKFSQPNVLMALEDTLFGKVLKIMEWRGSYASRHSDKAKRKLEGS